MYKDCKDTQVNVVNDRNVPADINKPGKEEIPGNFY
jgi:hypothetical protein